MRNLLIAILVGCVLFGLTLTPKLLGYEPYYDMTGCEAIAERYKDSEIKPPCGQVGESSPPWWASGLPLPVYTYGDCPSGCIEYFSMPMAIFDIGFWIVSSWGALSIYSKIRRRS